MVYRVIIDLRPELTGLELITLHQKIEAAFRNRAGSVIDTGDGSHLLMFAGGEADFGCLQLGVLALDSISGFMAHVRSCTWVDPDPDECCDLLVELAATVF